MKSSKEPIVLLLGSINHEGIVSALKATGRSYVHKMLHSTVKNWLSIIEIFENYEVKATLGKITSFTFNFFARDEYSQVADRLFKKISQKPHILFIFEGILSQQEIIDNPGDEEEPYYTDLPDEQTLKHTNALLAKYNINVLPYLTKAEVTVASQSFIEQTEGGLLFKVYLPSGNLWANEIDRVVILFKEYLSNICEQNVRLDQIRTTNGIIYTFHGVDGMKPPSLPIEFQEFSTLLELCINNPVKAEEMLKDKGLNTTELNVLITRYAKEARRLLVDLKHVRESKILSIRHRFESELTDIVSPNFDSNLLSQLVDSIIPPLPEISSTPSLPAKTVSPIPASLTVNLQPQIIEKIEGIVAQEISGNIQYSPEDQQLIELFKKHEPTKIPELTSALHELKDTSAPQAGRVLAKQKIKKFLFGCYSKVENLAFGVLQKYIENQMFGQ